MKDIFAEYHNRECEICGEAVCLSDCPADLLENDSDSLNDIVGLFEDYVPNNDILGNPIADLIGNHLFLIADAILSAQKKWEQKTYMNRIDDTLSTYRYFTNFSDALFQAGAFDSAEDVIEYLKNPKHYDKLYNIWNELDHPASRDDAFKIFKLSVKEFKNL